MAEQHKRAAAEYEKQARDAKALLEKLRAESKLKAKEIELSAQAGAVARKNLAESKVVVAQKETELAEEKGARAEAERALAEAQHGLELLRTQLEELQAQSKAIMASRSELADQVKRQGEHVARLEKEKESLLIEIEKLKDGGGGSDTKLEELEAQIITSREEHSRLQKRLAEQDAKLVRLTDLERMLADALKEHEVTVESLKQSAAECSTLTEKLAVAQEQHSKKDDIIATLQKELAIAKQDAEQQKGLLQDQLKLAQSLKSELDAISTDSERVKHLEDEMVRMKDSLSVAIKLRQDVEASLKSSEVKSKGLEVTVESLQSKIVKLEKQLTESRNLETSARVQTNTQSREKLEAVSRAQLAENAAQLTADALEQARAQLESANAELCRKNEELDKSDSIAAGLKEKASLLNKRLIKANDSYKMLENDLQNALVERDELRATLAGKEMKPGDVDDAALRLQALNKSLQDQLQEANSAHRHMASELEKMSLSRSLAIQEKQAEHNKSEKIIHELRSHLARDREKSNLMAQDMQKLEATRHTQLQSMQVMPGRPELKMQS
eukprot:g2639.t1